MTRIIRVEDRFRVSAGEIVVSGVNPDWDNLTAEQISALIGDRVLVRQLNGVKIEARVTGVSAPGSLAGKKNIHIRLALDDDVDVGSVISSTEATPNSVSM